MLKKLGLNKAKPNIMWIDLNSAFATTEQQAHPSLRGKPVGITNRISKNCCIITASYEAKRYGVKAGTSRQDALKICPDLVLLESDPSKYRHVYQSLFKIMTDYTNNVKMKSIDEGVLDFHGTAFENKPEQLVEIAYKIKDRVKKEIGHYMTINIGLGPNRFLAKTAAGLHKPDGLDIIDHNNIEDIYKTLKLEDLTGIAKNYGFRLRSNGINSPLDFLKADEEFLKKCVFQGINGAYWYLRLRGYEVDKSKKNLSMIGRQWVVNNPTADEEFLRSYLHYLTETTAMKLRYKGVEARGVCVWLKYSAGGKFSGKKIYKTPCFSNQEIWRRVEEVFNSRPTKQKVQTIGIYLYSFSPSNRNQIDLLGEKEKIDNLTSSIDYINDFYGIFTLYSAGAMHGTKNIKQKIPFGGTDYFDLLLKK